MRTWRLLALGVLAAGAVASAPAQAASVRVGLGADYWAGVGEGEFNLTFAIDQRVGRHFSIGGRFGALVTTNALFGVPLDFELRAHLPANLYLEGLVGPWLIFSGFPVRAHAGAGFGVSAGDFQAGIEVAYLSPGAIIGLRLAWRF